MANGTAADVRLGDLGHRQGREHARLRPAPLQRILDGERVEHGGEHAGVVAGCAVHPLGGRSHAAVDVARADDDPDLDAHRLDADDLLGDLGDRGGIDPELTVAHQRLT